MAKTEQLQIILNDIEKAELAKAADNLTLMEALKKVVLYPVYFNGTLQAGLSADPGINFALTLVANKLDATDQEIGADLRASSKAISLIIGGFNEVERFRAPKKDEKPKKNPAL